MAKTPSQTPTDQRVNNDDASTVPDAVINAAFVATPENTPLPGGGRWRWDSFHACWVANEDPATTTAPFPILE